DKYGFRKGNNVISAQDQTMYELAYEPIIARRRGRWRKLISTSHGNLPPRSKKLKRFVRKGIPPEFRGMCWLRYSGAEAKMLKNRGIYDDIVNRLEQRRVETGQVSEAEELIGRDLHRTFPHNSHFRLRLEERRQALGGRQHAQQHSVGSNTGILLAFVETRVEIGYHQALSYIAALLLLFVDEEPAYWMLLTIVDDILPPHYFDRRQEGSVVDQQIMFELIRQRLPALWRHFNRDTPQSALPNQSSSLIPQQLLISMAMSHWMPTLFVDVFPVETVLRIWDCLFCEVEST
ncbi:RabGAP/TBC, partial [Ramicandelaber brevisporus]